MRCLVGVGEQGFWGCGCTGARGCKGTGDGLVQGCRCAGAWELRVQRGAVDALVQGRRGCRGMGGTGAQEV